MSAQLLTKREVKELIEIFDEYRTMVKNLRSKYSLADDYIKNPRLPSHLGESLTAHLIKEGQLISELPSNLDVQMGGHGGDLQVFVEEKTILVEVKSASSKDGFTRLSEKDVNSDFLVYVFLGDYFRDEADYIEVLVIEGPSNFYNSGNEAYRTDLRENAHEKYEITPESL